MAELTAKTYLNAIKNDLMAPKITGGTIHDFLRNSSIKKSGGKCPTYHIIYMTPSGYSVDIGFNYATNGKPKLEIFENIDFVY